MSFTVHNCFQDDNEFLRIQQASAFSSSPYVNISRPILPGGEIDFQPSRATGAIRLSNNLGTSTSGTYIYTSDIELDNIFFRENSEVSSAGCRGGNSRERLTELTITNCLNSNVTLNVRSSTGGMRSTSLVIPSNQITPISVYIALDTEISFSGPDAPDNIYQVDGNDNDIFVNSDTISTNSCSVNGGGGSSNGTNFVIRETIFTVGNCYPVNGHLEIFNPNETQTQNIIVWDPVQDNNGDNIVVDSGGTAAVPLPPNNARDAIYRLRFPSNNQARVTPVIFLYTSLKPPTQVWFQPSRPFVSGSSCTVGQASDSRGSISIVDVANCNGMLINLLVQTRISNDNPNDPTFVSTLTNTAYPIENKNTMVFAIMVGTTIGFRNSSDTIGEALMIPAPASGFGLFVGPDQVGTEAMVCQASPTGIFTAFNCFDTPTESCSAGIDNTNNITSSNWILQQRVDGRWKSISCIPSNARTGVPVLPVTSTTNGIQTTLMINAAAFRVSAVNNNRSLPYVYTSDLPITEVYFRSDTISSSGCSGGTGRIVDQLFLNCTDTPLELFVSSNRMFVATGLYLPANGTLKVAVANGVIIGFKSEDPSGSTDGMNVSYTVTNQANRVFVGTNHIGTTSCDASNQPVDTDNSGAVESKPWILIIIVVVAVIFLIIIGLLVYKSYGRQVTSQPKSLTKTYQTTPTVGIQPGMVGIQPGMVGIQPGMVGIQPGMVGIQPGMVGIQPGMAGIRPGVQPVTDSFIQTYPRYISTIGQPTGDLVQPSTPPISAATTSSSSQTAIPTSAGQVSGPAQSANSPGFVDRFGRFVNNLDFLP